MLEKIHTEKHRKIRDIRTAKRAERTAHPA